MRTIPVVRDDAERVASISAGAERGSVVRAQNETAAVHGGESAATRLVLGHVVTARTTNVVSEIRTITKLLSHASVSRVGLRKEGKPGEKCGALKFIGDFVARGVRASGKEYAKGDSRCGYELHDNETEYLEG